MNRDALLLWLGLIVSGTRSEKSKKSMENKKEHQHKIKIKKIVSCWENGKESEGHLFLYRKNIAGTSECILIVATRLIYRYMWRGISEISMHKHISFEWWQISTCCVSPLTRRFSPPPSFSPWFFFSSLPLSLGGGQGSSRSIGCLEWRRCLQPFHSSEWTLAQAINSSKRLSPTEIKTLPSAPLSGGYW